MPLLLRRTQGHHPSDWGHDEWTAIAVSGAYSWTIMADGSGA